MKLGYVTLMGVLALGGCNKDITNYSELLCSDNEECVVLRSRDYLYKITREGEKIVKAEEYHKKDLETKIRDVLITESSTKSIKRIRQRKIL